MNLLYTSTAYPPSIGGAQIHHHLLAQQMANRHRVDVVCHWDTCRTDWLLGTTLRAPASPNRYQIDGIPVHRIGYSLRERLRLLPYVAAYYPLMGMCVKRIAQQVVEQITSVAKRADIIHNVRIGREGLSYACWQEARRRDVPFVLTPVHHPRWTGWRYRVYNELYRNADLLIALTQAERESLVRLGVAPERIKVTGIGPVLADRPQPDRFRDALGIDGPMVLFLGQHFRYKGFQQVFESRKTVWQSFPDTHFVFAGPSVGNSDRLFKNHDRRVHRLGATDLQTKTDALAACSVLCVPSTQESFGGVYTEAWSFAKPVIGCDIPPVANVISDGEDGFLVQQDGGEIADRICQILRNESDARAMGSTGREKVTNRYTWERLAKATEEAYESLSVIP